MNKYEPVQSVHSFIQIKTTSHIHQEGHSKQLTLRLIKLFVSALKYFDLKRKTSRCHYCWMTPSRLCQRLVCCETDIKVSVLIHYNI